VAAENLEAADVTVAAGPLEVQTGWTVEVADDWDNVLVLTDHTKSAFQNLVRQVDCVWEADGIRQWFLRFSSMPVSLRHTSGGFEMRSKAPDRARRPRA
jgi:hypothetical protein